MPIAEWRVVVILIRFIRQDIAPTGSAQHVIACVALFQIIADAARDGNIVPVQ